MMIKVCGNCIPENIAAVASLTPMLMGFIFYEPSPRNACSLAPNIIADLPNFIRPVAIFVDKPIDEMLDIVERYGFKIVQLHGSESPDTCMNLKQLGLTVFKAFGLDDDTDLKQIKPYEGTADLFVFDTASDARGGSGKKFDWHKLDGYELSTPYLLSGGIGPDDIDSIIAAMRPRMAGIDINSRFETSPGVKNITTLTHFILSLRNHNENEPSTTPFWEKTK